MASLSPATASSSRPRRYTTITPPEFDASNRRQELKLLVSSTGCIDPYVIKELLPQLADLPDVKIRSILDNGFGSHHLISASSSCLVVPNASRQFAVSVGIEIEQEAVELCEWADLLVLAPMDANNMAKMLQGTTDNLLLEVLRNWDVSKKIFMVPGMSCLSWENPMTKKQLSKIRRKWNWVRVLQPVLWTFEADQKNILSWDAMDELKHAIRNQIDLMNIGQDLDVTPALRSIFITPGKVSSSTLPPELWSIIMDFANDWELAQALHIYTNLPPPADWASHTSPHGPRNYMESLELTILRGNLSDVKHFIATHSVPRWLSKLCIRLIMRFAMTPLLSHLEANHKDLFWATFGHTFLPDKASSVFGRTEILEFWRTSPSFLTKEYSVEALDGASRAGFVNVLEWWQQSGLPLKYTEAALEQASSQGHVQVLEWWKSQSSATDDTSISETSTQIRLKPGKSIVFATQNGHTDIVRWWAQSGIAFPHEDTIAKLASTHGHVETLAFWHEFKGNKMIFDNQVLIGATKMGNVDVLEWWKRSGLKVEYKIFELEEALEDGREGLRAGEVQRWWARNGLNLGVGTSEWMRTKYLNS